MRSICITIGLILLLAVSSSARYTETTIEIQIDSVDQLQELTRLISIYDRDGNTVRAVATRPDRLEALTAAGYTYTVIPQPKEPVSLKMGTAKSVSTTWDSYPTYTEYVNMMYQFQTDYPTLCQTFDIGNTVLGRDLLVVKLSANVTVEENEPEVFYTSTMHGDETTGFVLMLRLIDSLLSTYGTDARVTRMLDSMEIWINPNANPDGTYRTDDNSVSGATRGNWNGVDLNRNFIDPDDGDHPDGNAWQPETMAMMDFAGDHNFVISANFHGGIELVNYPWDTWFRRHPDDQWFINICRQYVDSAQAYSPFGYMDALNNGITNGWDWYPIAGGRQDFMNYFHGCRENTIELSNTKLVPGSTLPNYWVYNRIALLDYLEQALYGIRGTVTDINTSAPLDATINVLGHDTEPDSSQVYTDPDVGDYHRMIESGVYDVEFLADGYLPDTVFNVIVVDRQSTYVDVQLSPTPNFACGDINGSGSGPDIADLTYLVAYMFAGGPAPLDPDAANVNGAGGIDVSDLTYLVAFMFKSGATLNCP